MMNRFHENNCRLCKKVFCCKKCREQHESSVHKVFADCHICLYGKTLIRNPSECLIKHLKTQHWPLHCVFCKRFFGTLEELLKQSKCPVGYKNKDLEKSPYTPQSGGENYESPPYFPKGLLAPTNANMFSNLATSTPMQKEETDLSEKCTEEIVTPVDFSDINKDKQYGSASPKRKVTFCETPITESYKKQKNMLTSENKFEDLIIVTPSSGDNNSPTIFYSAKQCLQEDLVPNEADENQINTASPKKTENKINNKINEETEVQKNEEVRQEDSTIWISAINVSPADFVKENAPLVDLNSTTPVIAKLKKRQVNVVVPTAIRERDVELELPTNIHAIAINDFQTEENTPAYPSNTPVYPSNTPVYPSLQIKSDESDELFESTNAISNVSSSSSRDINGVLSETSLNPSGILWTSVSKLVKNVTNVVHGFSSVTFINKPSVKRSILEYDSLDGPPVKRYKLTEIKCRRPIRDLARRERFREIPEYAENASSSCRTVEVKKIFVDKATQTDEWLLN